MPDTQPTLTDHQRAALGNVLDRLLLDTTQVQLIVNDPKGTLKNLGMSDEDVENISNYAQTVIQEFEIVGRFHR